jgi:hypothetical protein
MHPPNPRLTPPCRRHRDHGASLVLSGVPDGVLLRGARSSEQKSPVSLQKHQPARPAGSPALADQIILRAHRLTRPSHAPNKYRNWYPISELLSVGLCPPASRYCLAFVTYQEGSRLPRHCPQRPYEHHPHCPGHPAINNLGPNATARRPRRGGYYPRSRTMCQCESCHTRCLVYKGTLNFLSGYLIYWRLTLC